MLDILKKYNLSRPKLVVIAIILTLVIAIPLTIIQVQKQQEIRQRAEGKAEALVTLNMTPTQINVKQDNTFSVGVSLGNHQRKDISAVDITIMYNKDLLTLSKFKPSESFKPLKQDNQTEGIFHYVWVNYDPSSPSPLRSEKGEIALGTIMFQAINPGKGNIDFDRSVSRVNVAGIKTYKNVGISYLPASYTIEPKDYKISGTIYVDSNEGRKVFNPKEDRKDRKDGNITKAYVGLLDPLDPKRKETKPTSVAKISDEGKYVFDNIEPGTYQLFLPVPKGYRPTVTGGNLKGAQGRLLPDPALAEYSGEIKVRDADLTVNFYITSDSSPVNKVDLNDKDSINKISQYNLINDCFEKDLVKTEKCKDNKKSVDLDNSNTVDSLDLNLFYRCTVQGKPIVFENGNYTCR